MNWQPIEMTQFVSDPWGAGSYPIASQVETEQKPTYSRLLDASGRPLLYHQHPRVGFDLTPKKEEK